MSNKHYSTFEFRRRTPGSFILVPCSKEGRSIGCQGHLEADAATILAECPQVVRIIEQPFRIWYSWIDGKGFDRIRILEKRPEPWRRKREALRTSYIVSDFFVEMVDGKKRLIEVKPTGRLDRPRVQRKLAVARLFADSEGWSFHLLTERELHRGLLLANLRLIRRYQSFRTDPRLVDSLSNLVSPEGIRLEYLLQQTATLATEPVRYSHILHLLGTGKFTFDPCSHPLDQNCLLFPKGAFSWDPFASVWAPSGGSTSEPSACSANRLPIDSPFST